MSHWQNRSPAAEPHPFSLRLAQAAKFGGDARQANPRPRGILDMAATLLRSGWQWLQRARAAQTAGRRLRVTETISLGDKRFLSIVQVDGAHFLIGSSAASVQLLTPLGPQPGGAVPLAPETGESA